MLGIVILNYLNWEDTVECVESIFDQTYSDYHIVIVDNCSTNESSEKLHDLYNGSMKVNIIDAKENVGFARGNNLGIYYLRTRYSVKRVLLLNSDTVMSDRNYLKILSELRINSNCGAVGTKIIGGDRLNQNPEYFPLTVDYSTLILKNLSNQNRGVVFSIKKLLRTIPGFQKAIARFKRFLNFRKNYTALHGSAIMLTENYFYYFNGLYPKTFLYFEENILAIVFKKFDLDFLYYPKTKIIHKEDRSSTLAWGNSNSVKQKYLVESVRESLEVFNYTKADLQKIINDAEENEL